MCASLRASSGRATRRASVEDVAVQAPANVIPLSVCLFIATVIVDGHWSARFF